MSKQQMGNRISGKKACAERYIPLREFLLFDPKYKGMSEKAKILYTFLRSKIPLFELKQEQFENGESGTRSYRDQDGNIYILADNTELTYILNCSEPTLVTKKKELKKYGLMEEDPVKDGPNLIYVLEPAALSDRWTHIDEINQLREEKRTTNKMKWEEKRAKSGNLKNLSHGNLKNLSHGNLKNLSKLELNGFKSNLITKIQLNQSIKEVDQLNVPDELKGFIESKKKRLIDLHIPLENIESNYSRHKDEINSMKDYTDALELALNNNKIINLNNLMDSLVPKSIAYHAGKKQTSQSGGVKPSEVVPEWFKPREEQQQHTEFAAEQSWSKKEIEESVNARLEKKQKDDSAGYNKEDIAKRIERLKAAHS